MEFTKAVNIVREVFNLLVPLFEFFLLSQLKVYLDVKDAAVLMSLFMRAQQIQFVDN